jgi:hypothetical protein
VRYELPDGLYAYDCPTTDANRPALGAVPALLLRTRLVPLAVPFVAMADAESVQTRGRYAMACVAVRVEVPTAVKVNVTLVCDVSVKAPVTVPLVYGDTRVSGESIDAVFVMLAEDGVDEYDAVKVGFVTVAPISTVDPPEKPVIEKPAPMSSLVSCRSENAEPFEFPT